MSDADTIALIRRYYAAFNDGDTSAMLDCVSNNIEHRVNEGETRHGRDAFAAFCARMGVAYRERLADLVVFAAEAGRRAAAEFTVHGTYLKGEDGLPSAHGQTYRLPAGAFFDVADGRITRISTFYNLSDWIAQVEG